MKRNETFILILVGLILASGFIFIGCKNQSSDSKNSSFFEKGDHIIKNAVKDIDGNSYDAVKLGNQVWMAENLRTKGSLHEYRENTGYDVCYFSGDNGEIYYNGVAALNELCPKGWHVPSGAEWDELERYCMRTPQYKCGNSDTYIAKALADSIGWKYYIHPESYEYNDIAYNPLTTNNATGFSARGYGIAHGYDNKDVYFDYEDGERAYFWTSDLEGDPADDKMCFRVLMAEEAILGHGEYVSLGDWQINTTSYEIGDYGLSVRCVKNKWEERQDSEKKASKLKNNKVVDFITSVVEEITF